MRGALHIQVGRDRTGVCRVIESRASAPFHYLPPELGVVPRLTIVNSSGGVLGGDALEAEIEVLPRAALRLRTQAATKVYRTRGPASTSLLQLRVGEGAALDYKPDELIPFAGSDYEQTTEVDLAGDAMLLLSDVVTAGRLGRGERFAFRRLVLGLRICRSGLPVITELAELRPESLAAGAAAVLADFPVWGTLHFVTPDGCPPDLVEAVDRAFSAVSDGRGGATATRAGISGRVLATNVEAAHDAIERARRCILESRNSTALAA